MELYNWLQYSPVRCAVLAAAGRSQMRSMTTGPREIRLSHAWRGKATAASPPPSSIDLLNGNKAPAEAYYCRITYIGSSPEVPELCN